MAASTSLLTDANTIISTGFNAASLATAASVTPGANAVATEGGVPADPVGLANLYKTKIQEAKKILQQMDAFVDNTDTLKTTIANNLLTLS